jgi:mRNA interferase RelE/StbE
MTKNKIWIIKWSDEARKQLRKLDNKLQDKIIKYLGKRIINAQNPRDFGKALKYDKYGLWRYRVEDARIVCQIKEKELIILVLNVGHRKNIYQ